MRIIRLFSSCLFVVALIPLLAGCYQPDGNPMSIDVNNEVIFQDVIFDESISPEFEKKILAVFSINNLVQATRNVSRFTIRKSVTENFTEQLGRTASNIKVMAIWQNKEDTTFSIQAQIEWHVSFDNQEFKKGRLKIVELIAIDPNAGIE